MPLQEKKNLERKKNKPEKIDILIFKEKNIPSWFFRQPQQVCFD